MDTIKPAETADFTDAEIIEMMGAELERALADLQAAERREKVHQTLVKHGIRTRTESTHNRSESGVEERRP